MNRLRTALRSGDDSGFGMILVMGTTTVVMALMVVTGTIAMRSLKSGRTHDSFSTSLAAAEAGVDQALARVQAAYDFNGSDFRTPHAGATAFDGSPDCVADEDGYAFTPGADATNAEETAWAKEKLYELAQIPGCLHTTARGEYVMLKPKGRQTVYAMGWSPAFVAPATPGGAVPDQRHRMIKAEYIFAPYKPAHAILTGGSLALESGSTDVDNVAPGIGASVHSNGNVTVTGQPNVTGAVSWNGTGPASAGNFGSRGQAPKQAIPTIEATSLYGKEVTKSKYATSWYDLCPDGKVYRGDTTGPAITPCTGTLVDSDGSFAGGWTFKAAVGSGPPTWEVDDPTINGIYYVSQANVLATASNGSISNMTIIASSRTPTTCSKVGGNIQYDGHLDIEAPAMDGLFLYADQDLAITEGNRMGKDLGTTAISGGFFAGDQFSSTTSSSHLYGSVIAGEECDPSGSLVDDNLVKASDITFDPNGYTPLTDVVNTTLWLELTG